MSGQIFSLKFVDERRTDGRGRLPAVRTLTKPARTNFDSENGGHRGYAFVSYETFEEADLAIECMNGQFFGNRVIKFSMPKERNEHAARVCAERFSPRTLSRGGSERYRAKLYRRGNLRLYHRHHHR